jgi:formylglycine-generating enzyme required for sulfatase activity
MKIFFRLRFSPIIVCIVALLLGGGQACHAENNAARDPYTGMELVALPGGCFTAGANDGNSDEKPLHEVCISPFYIGRYEVTQGEWRHVMGSNPSFFSKCGDDCPIDQISWSDAQEFIYRLNRLTGRNYRLPTEAEWEYACRGGGKVDKFCGGEVDTVAWYDRNSGNRVHQVGRKKPNSFGIFDMSGNVWEWVQDWNGRYPAERGKDPQGPSSGSSRVRRGGSWLYDAAKARATWRSSGYQDDRAIDIGFRLAHPAETRQGR